MAKLELIDIVKSFGATNVLHGISLTIDSGEFVSLLGPSGCGKTTLLRIIAGLEGVTRGSVRIGGTDVTAAPPEERDIAMMFQSYALLPHMSVRDNIRFPLRMRKRGTRAQQDERVQAALETVQLAHLAERMPRQLSGGQQQRVALARAIVSDPKILLLDEPLSNLDARLREDMQVELIELHRRLGLTTVFVTHDQEEALAIADRLVVMNQGSIVQVGTPRELYEEPRTAFVADFMGRSNFFEGQVSSPGTFQTRSGLILHFSATAPTGRAIFAMRPDRIGLLRENEAATSVNIVPGTARAVTFLGPITEVVVDLPTGETVIVHGPTASDTIAPVKAGESIRLTWPAEASQVLDASDWPTRTGTHGNNAEDHR